MRFFLRSTEIEAGQTLGYLVVDTSGVRDRIDRRFHDLPFALELCPRSLVFSDGAVVADGKTADLLADRDLMEQHRLALPFGFDPRAAV